MITVNLISILNSANSSTLETYRNKVQTDGGTIINEDYLTERLDHAKENGYFSDIAVWYASEFGVKIAGTYRLGLSFKITSYRY